jgi:hypothetical protein
LSTAVRVTVGGGGGQIDSRNVYKNDNGSGILNIPPPIVSVVNYVTVINFINFKKLKVIHAGIVSSIPLPPPYKIKINKNYRWFYLHTWSIIDGSENRIHHMRAACQFRQYRI